MGSAFGRICREAMLHYGPEWVGEPVREVGKSWGGEFDIDVAGQTLGRIPFFGECQWSARPVGRGTLHELRQRAARTPYGGGQLPYELLFSRSGFSPELQALAGVEGRVVLVGLERLLGRGTRAPT